MIKVVLSWVVVIYVMFSSVISVTMLFEKVIWKGNPTLIESLATCIVASITVVIANLTTLYATGLWTP